MSTPAGWYDDGSGRQRWWDGQQWTDNYADQQAAPAAEPAPEAAAPQADDERKYADEAPAEDGAEAIASTPEPSPVPAPTPMPEQPAYAAAPAAQPAYTPQPAAQEPKKSRTGLIIGIVVGAIVLLLVIVGAIIALAVGGLTAAVSGPNDATDALYDAWATEDCAAEFDLTTEYYNGGDEDAFCTDPDYSFLDGMESYEITGTSVTNDTAVVTVDEDWGDYVDVWEYELVEVDGEWLVDDLYWVETK